LAKINDQYFPLAKSTFLPAFRGLWFPDPLV